MIRSIIAECHPDGIKIAVTLDVDGLPHRVESPGFWPYDREDEVRQYVRAFARAHNVDSGVHDLRS